ncbi:MAG: ABC transporter substrate-binding protein [Burkholderiales bacterium]
MSKNRLFWMSLVLGGALVQSGAALAQGTIKFGFMSSLSGPFTPWGVEVRDGMKMAIDELNAKGGAMGRKLELVERDDKNNPNEGITSFKYMVEREGIVAAGGMISSDVGLAVSRQAEDLKVPFFLTMSGSHEILKKSSRYTFRTCLVAAPQNMDAIASMIKEKKITRVGVVIADYAWGHSLREAVETLIKPLPGVQLQIEVAPVPEKDFTPYLRKLQAMNPELIIATGHPPGTPTITRQVIELGMKAQIIGPWMPGTLMVQRAGELIFNRYVDYSCADFESPAYKQLAERYNATTKRLFDNNAFSGYVMVKMVADAIERSKSVDPKVIADTIRKGSFNQPGYAWPLAYTEWGEMKGAKPIMYTWEKGDPGKVNAGATSRQALIFRTPASEPYVPKD